MDAELMINVARWLPRSSVNGPGERFVLWVQGCPLHCPGCWNPDTWSFAPRRVMGVTELFEQILMAEPIDGVTFTGGEPFAQAAALAELAERLQSRKLSLMAFTGYGLEELTGAEHVRFLRCLDVVVTGRFVNELKAEGLLWRGSSNQEVHLLTDRHAGLAVCDTEHPSAEVVITHNGTQIVSGFPESGLLRQLDPVGVNRPGHGPPQ